MAATINRENWKILRISELAKPFWLCPSCFSGQLEIPKNWAITKMNAESQVQNAQYLDAFPEKIKSKFVGFLRCSNIQCNEYVALIGTSGYDTHWDYNMSDERMVEYFEPLFIHPSINIFPVSKDCPEDIANQIIKSFSHYFSDTSASANAIRTSLELIMNQQKVDKTKLNRNNKREKLMLHARINLFGASNVELKPYLIAAKWIGNAGSHIGEVSYDDLLDGYELLQHCIYELYEKPKTIKSLSAKVKIINKRKKPIQGK